MERHRQLLPLVEACSVPLASRIGAAGGCTPAQAGHSNDIQRPSDDPFLEVPIHCMDELQKAALACVARGENVFISGSAGVGKSAVSRAAIRILQHTHGVNHVGVCAPTGIAAVPLNGSTIHSLMGIGISNYYGQLARVWADADTRARLFGLKALVIDEVSMLSGELLDALDDAVTYSRRFQRSLLHRDRGAASENDHSAAESERAAEGPLRVHTGGLVPNTLLQDAAFDGIQLVFVGDFAQLPPIEARWSTPVLGSLRPAHVGVRHPYFNALDSYFRVASGSSNLSGSARRSHGAVTSVAGSRARSAPLPSAAASALMPSISLPADVPACIAIPKYSTSACTSEPPSGDSASEIGDGRVAWQLICNALIASPAVALLPSLPRLSYTVQRVYGANARERLQLQGPLPAPTLPPSRGAQSFLSEAESCRRLQLPPERFPMPLRPPFLPMPLAPPSASPGPSGGQMPLAPPCVRDDRIFTCGARWTGQFTPAVDPLHVEPAASGTSVVAAATVVGSDNDGDVSVNRGRDMGRGVHGDALAGTFFAFESHAWVRARLRPFVLERVYRQRDAAFIGLLNELREGVVSVRGEEMLRSLKRPLIVSAACDSFKNVAAAAAIAQTACADSAVPLLQAVMPLYPNLKSTSSIDCAAVEAASAPSPARAHADSHAAALRLAASEWSLDGTQAALHAIRLRSTNSSVDGENHEQLELLAGPELVFLAACVLRPCYSDLAALAGMPPLGGEGPPPATVAGAAGAAVNSNSVSALRLHPLSSYPPRLVAAQACQVKHLLAYSAFANGGTGLVPPRLRLRRTAHVMLLTNLDVGGGLANGTRGQVVGFCTAREEYTRLLASLRDVEARDGPTSQPALDRLQRIRRLLTSTCVNGRDTAEHLAAFLRRVQPIAPQTHSAPAAVPREAGCASSSPSIETGVLGTQKIRRSGSSAAVSAVCAGDSLQHIVVRLSGIPGERDPPVPYIDVPDMRPFAKWTTVRPWPRQHKLGEVLVPQACQAEHTARGRLVSGSDDFVTGAMEDAGGGATLTANRLPFMPVVAAAAAGEAVMLAQVIPGTFSGTGPETLPPCKRDRSRFVSGDEGRRVEEDLEDLLVGPEAKRSRVVDTGHDAGNAVAASAADCNGLEPARPFVVAAAATAGSQLLPDPCLLRFKLHGGTSSLASDESTYPQVLFQLAPPRLPRVELVEPFEFSEHHPGVGEAALYQVPLKLCWALTIHKSQGMSLDACEADLSRCFADGQAYVALSRARTLQGLRVTGFAPGKVTAAAEVIFFHRLLEQRKTMVPTWSATTGSGPGQAS